VGVVSEDSREISDAQTMRALAHPVRLALLDAIRAEGEITATRAAEVLGDSPGNMSWHLQTLAKYGFVEESGTGKGRSRPWRLVQRNVRFNSATAPDAEARAAGDALESALINRTFTQLEEWRRRRSDYPTWAEESFITNSVTYLTPTELGELASELSAVIHRFADRQDPERRPEGAVAVKVVAMGHPLAGGGLSSS
jgi:DNA-binding transcriptional ArsR family regulator